MGVLTSICPKAVAVADLIGIIINVITDQSWVTPLIERKFASVDRTK